MSSVRSNSQCLRFQRLAPSGYKYIGIKKLGLVFSSFIKVGLQRKVISIVYLPQIFVGFCSNFHHIHIRSNKSNYKIKKTIFGQNFLLYFGNSFFKNSFPIFMIFRKYILKAEKLTLGVSGRLCNLILRG